MFAGVAYSGLACLGVAQRLWSSGPGRLRGLLQITLLVVLEMIRIRSFTACGAFDKP